MSFDPLGAEDEVEICALLQAADLLDHGLEAAPQRAHREGGLVGDEGARGQVGGQGAGGVVHPGEVGVPGGVVHEEGDHQDDRIGPGDGLGVVGGGCIRADSHAGDPQHSCSRLHQRACIAPAEVPRCSADPAWIADAVGVSGSTLSGHLRTLREAELVDTRRRGTEIQYRVNLTLIDEAMLLLASLGGTLKAPDPTVRLAQERREP